MTDEKGNRFCTKCGAPLPEDSSFCPHCGANLSGAANPYAGSGPSPYANYQQGPAGPDTLGSTPMLIMLYGIFAVVMGIMVTMGSTMITEEFWHDVYPDMAYDESYKTMAALMGVSGLLSGVFAMVSGYLSTKRVKYTIAFYTCLLASIASIPMGGGLIGILTMAIGLLMSMRLKKSKNAFRS